MTTRDMRLRTAALAAMAVLVLTSCASEQTSVARPDSGNSSASPAAATMPRDTSRPLPSVSPSAPETDSDLAPLLAAVQDDPSLTSAATAPVRSHRISGTWALLDIATPGEGVRVLLQQAKDGTWSVADAGGAGVGCPFVSPGVAADLDLFCP